MTQLQQRLALQAHVQQILHTAGREPGWHMIAQVIQQEIAAEHSRCSPDPWQRVEQANAVRQDQLDAV